MSTPFFMLTPSWRPDPSRKPNRSISSILWLTVAIGLACAFFLAVPGWSQAPGDIESGCHGATPTPIANECANADGPNIVMIMFDDLGSGDLSPYAADPVIETPVIQQLAEEGMVFDQYYATPTCSPTRVSLLSGGYQQRLNVRRQLQLDHDDSNRGVPSTVLTALPQMLKEEGYRTAHFGKWHAGFRKEEFRPLNLGFDAACTLQEQGDLPGEPTVYGETGLRYCNPGVRDGNDDLGIPVDGYTTEILIDYAIDFIQRPNLEGCPFFVQIWLWAPHTELSWNTCPEDQRTRMNGLLTKYDNLGVLRSGRRYAAIIDRADQEIGRLMDALPEDTLVIVASDNGGTAQFGNELDDNGEPNGPPTLPPTNGPLTGLKGQVYEGGIRSPLIVRWGTHIPPAPGGTCNEQEDPLCPYTRHSDPVMRYELYPTLAQLAGHDLDTLDFDGQSFADIFTAPSTERPNPKEELVWEHQPTKQGFVDDDDQWSDWAVRKEDWKLTYDNRCVAPCEGCPCDYVSNFGLFNLAASVTETEDDDLSNDPTEAGRFDVLHQAYLDWRRRVTLLPLEGNAVGGAKVQGRDLRTVPAEPHGQFLRLDADTRHDFFDGSFSFSAQVKPDSGSLPAPGCTQNCRQTLAYKGDSWELAIIASRHVQLTVFNEGGGSQILQSTQPLQEDQWNWVAFSVYGWRNGDSLVRLYTNSPDPVGCAHAATPSAPPCTGDVTAVQRNDNRVLIGGDFAQRQFVGTFRDVELRLSSLQDEEIATLYERFTNGLFYDSFEGGLGAWEPAVIRGNATLGLVSPGFIDTQRLAIGINGVDQRAFVTTLTPQDETRVRVSFAADLSGLTLGGPQRLLVGRKLDGGVANVFWVEVQNAPADAGAPHEARARALTDGGVDLETPWLPFDGRDPLAPQTIEVLWQKGEASFEDGFIRLRIGDRTTERRGIDNDGLDLDVDRIDLGLVNKAATGTAGTLYLDGFKSYRD